MATDKSNYDKKTKIQFTMPSQNASISSSKISSYDASLKDQLMKLIIETKDEPIELKITGDQYRKIGIHDEWRQVDFNTKKAAYFSYQEKAAKEFIFRFNKCGILSDQVGMGKTIEAGMIISELAYRKELGSLLILVPNENMSEKWENELAKKFGFRNFYKDVTYINGKEETKVASSTLPKVYSIKSLSDLHSLIYSAYDAIYPENGNTLESSIKLAAAKHYHTVLNNARIKSIRQQINDMLRRTTHIHHKEFKLAILNEVYSPVIEDFVKAVSIELGFENEFNNSNYRVNPDGHYYHIVDMYLDSPITQGILVNGIMDRIFDEEVITNSLVNEFDFIKNVRGIHVLKQLSNKSKQASNEDERLEYIALLRRLADKIRKTYAILIVSKVVNHQEMGIIYTQFSILDYILNEDYDSESIRYCSISTVVNRGYRVMDMLIDMSYKTLIVDEAHDYIKVSHKIPINNEVIKTNDYYTRQKDGLEFSDLDLSREHTNTENYYVFPLYNDYYFVKKNCLFGKVKTLAERSYRKIFMTATPIKSDMVDFYLLYLLTDNSDTNTTNRIRKMIEPKQVASLATLLLNNLSNSHKKSLNYLTHEDLVVHYIHSLYNNRQDELTGRFDDKIYKLIELSIKDESVDLDILKEICVNQVRLQFQKTFTIKNDIGDDIEIKTISDLVSSEEGIEQWQNMYSQIGIRSTRHQTFKLDDTHLKLIKLVQREKYSNLPIWSRRNGTIVYIHKKDNFFDLVVKEKLELMKESRKSNIIDYDKLLELEMIDNPKLKDIELLKNNTDDAIKKINEDDITDKAKELKIKEEGKKLEHAIEKLEKQYVPKERALAIYKYINNQLTGMLSTADYYSTDVDYDDFKLHMVVKLMTDGLEIQGQQQTKKIGGKVLLFTDISTKDKVFQWMSKEADFSGKTISDSNLTAYVSRYKHQPLWYYNSEKKDPNDRWIITSDIKALNDKNGNFLIIVEPDKYEEGVDLQSSNILINFDIKFCPLKMEQRIGRIDRVKLNAEQSQLEIVSFTPLNDMSGFMVDFLANELKMFSCWKGDTTGIVSMPLSNKPNSATFEDAILSINQVYKALYNYDPMLFLSSCKRLLEMESGLYHRYYKKIENFTKNEPQIVEDFKYLSDSCKYVNDIIYHTDCSNNEKGDEGKIMFGDLCVLAKKVALKNEEISSESISNHKNELQKLKDAIKDYYDHNINHFKNLLREIRLISLDTQEHGEKIESTYGSNLKGLVKRLDSQLREFETEVKLYNTSELATLPPGQLGINKKTADKVILPILNRYKKTIIYYLDVIVELFENLCADVSDRSLKMSKFISLLTIDEFKVMAENYE